MSAGLLGLRDKRALVTGGSRGVGRATALLLARAGADVGVGYRNRSRDAGETVAAIRALGRRGWCEPGDLSRAEDAARLFERAREEFGGIDLVVANAGVWPAQKVGIGEMPERRWRSTVQANLTSVFHTVRLAAGSVADGGRVVVVSSTAGQRGEPFHADYATAKGAVISLVKSVAVELAPRGVTVNAVAPGWTDTEMVEEALAGRRAEVEQTIPLGRVAPADDVAGPILFLCSALARHVTGEVLNVNGGSVLCG